MADKIFRICLDAGHYGYYNQSPANKSYYESKAMWTLHLLLKKYLEGHGFEVVTTRSNQATDLELTARGRKSVGCDLFLSLHSNAVDSSVNETVDYVVAYALTDDKATKIDDISREIGDILARTVANIMYTTQTPRVNTRLSDNDRNGDGVLNDNYYGVLHGARAVGTPGVILEHSFHTNTKATNWLLNESNLDRLAKAEAEVIAKYFGVTKKEDVPVSNKKVTVLEWQKSAIADGFKFPKYGADGLWGSECEGVAKNAIVKKRGTYMYKNLTKIVQRVVGVEADGLCGNITHDAIVKYQKAHGLVPDGCVGINTWRVILGV